MGWQIIKQPDDKFAIWSTIVDDFIVMDKTKEAIIAFYAEDGRKRSERDAKERIDDIEIGDDIRYGSYTYDDCIRILKWNKLEPEQVTREVVTLVQK